MPGRRDVTTRALSLWADLDLRYPHVLRLDGVACHGRLPDADGLGRDRLEAVLGDLPGLLVFDVELGDPLAAVPSLYLVGGGDELCSKMYDNLNIHYVASMFEGPEVWAHSTVPLDDLDALTSIKMRAAGDGGEILARMGVAVVYFPSSEAYEAVQRGVVDAFESGGPAVNWGRGFHEVTDYMYLSPSRAPLDVRAFIVNKDAWEKLSPDLQSIVEMAVREEGPKWLAEQIVTDSEVLEKYLDYGTDVRAIPNDIEVAYAAEAAKLYDEKAGTDPLAAEILESQRQFKAFCELQNIR